MTSYPQEATARSLAHRIRGFTAAEAEGVGVHWHVDAGLAGQRRVRIHCFHYDETLSALTMGLNPANARNGQRDGARPARTGDEYLTRLFDGDSEVADGRSFDVAAVEAAVRAWLAGKTLSELELIAPYVDERRRVMRLIANDLDPLLRRDLGRDPMYDLWVYSDRRACRVRCGTPEVECTFWIGGAEVAFGRGIDDVGSAVHAWLSEDTSTSDIPLRAPGVALGRHAELLELDPARWHWLHLQDRLADSEDVLAPLAPLLERLAQSPIASRFFSFSSLNRFCFSASSHYPWVTDNLPTVTPGRGGVIYVDDVECDMDSAILNIEKRLAEAEVSPFFGSRIDYNLRMLELALQKTGSTWRPELHQSANWSRIVGTGSDGRTCEVRDLQVRFVAGETETETSWATFDVMADALVKFCERGITLVDIIPGTP